MKVKKKKSDSNSEEIQEETQEIQTDKSTRERRVKLTNLEKEDLKNSILQNIIELYTPKQVEARVKQKYGICLRTVQKYVAIVRQELKDETPQVDVEKARGAQKGFIMGRIHYCLEQANKKNPTYERLLQDWIKQFNTLFPNELRVEQADSEKQINITFNKKAK